jgi:membrane-associated protease RseP (regulator of RpoE activity)
VFLYARRKNIKVEGKIFFLYPTQFGVKFIDKIGSRHKKLFRVLSWVSIITGYLLMISSLILFIDLLKTLINFPSLFKVLKVPPIMPIFPYFTNVFKVSYLPPFYFAYWIISIAIIAIVHEFSHGIFARFYGVKIKSTGFGFLGPFIAAFVEPDEKQLQQKSKKAQIAVLTAGSFANIITTIVFLIILLSFTKIFFMTGGVLFDGYANALVNVSDITMVGKTPMNNPMIADLYAVINSNPGYYDLGLNIDGQSINLTKIIAANRTYLATGASLVSQVEFIMQSKNYTSQIIAFEDSPMIEQGIFGAISKVGEFKITNRSDLKNAILAYNPNDTITIDVIDSDYNKKQYTIVLAENPGNSSQAMLGIGFALEQQATSTKGLMYYARMIGEKLRDSHVFVVPKFHTGIIIFIYNLLWWIVFLNLSVALVNMLPLGIFDGGRVFYLTMLGLTKSKRKADILFKIAMYIILSIFIILTVMWFANK